MKTNVTMEQKVCPICGNENQTGAILNGECDDCKEKLDNGYVAMVVIENDRNGIDRIKMEDANRTGEILFIKAEFAKHIFVGVQFAEGINIAVKFPRMLFIDVDGCVKLTEQIKEIQEQ